MNTQLKLMAVATASLLAMAGCATTSSGYAGSPPPAGSSANCYDCGTVTRIETTGSGTTGVGVTGAVIGGIVGAAAGRELTEDESRGRQNTATVAGAAAGAAAGSAIQRGMTGGTTYNIHVRMNDGRTTVVSQNSLGGIREGSYVRVYNGRAWVR